MSVAPESSAHDSGEDRLIARFFRPLARHPGAFGLVDDAAVLTPPPGQDVVLKADAIIAGVHFFPDDPADLVARKALRVNLSDLAAKGSKPAGFLLSLALPADIGDAWLEVFARGLAEDVEAYDCPLMGGDTDRTPGPAMISIACFGLLPHATMVPRTGARIGDRVVVTGTIGDAALGLVLRRDATAATRWGLNEDEQGHLAARYLLPQPRLAIAAALRTYAHAAMDVSDGLAGDLGKLCRASGVDAVIDVADVPMSVGGAKAIAADPAMRETALTGGDDFEIIATVPEAKLATLQAAGRAAGVPVTEIGYVAAGRGEARFIDSEGRQLAFRRPSFSHFE